MRFQASKHGVKLDDEFANDFKSTAEERGIESPFNWPVIWAALITGGVLVLIFTMGR